MATILIVDDRPLNREFLVILLGSAHYHLLEAADGAEALNIAKTQFLDLIITDILMLTMDGLELANQLNMDPNLKKIPIIFYTATYRHEEARTLAESCGVRFVLTKPSDPQLILDTVQKALGIPKPTAKSKSKPIKETLPVIREVEPVSLSEINTDLSKRFSEIENIRKSFKIFIENSKVLAKEHDISINEIKILSENLKQLHKLTNRLVQMAEFNLDLVSETDSKKLLLLFCKGVRKLLEAKYAVLGVLDEKEGGLKHFLVSGMENKAQSKMSAPRHTDQGLIGRVLKSKGVLKINDPHLLSKAELLSHHPPISCLLGFPIFTKSSLYGFIYFADKVDGTFFSDEDGQIAQTLISELAALYENMEFYNILQHHATKLQIEVVERKKAQLALTKSELFFRQFAENANEVFWRTNSDMDKVIYVSPAYEQVWGSKLKDIYANPFQWFESILPEDQPRVKETYGQLIAGNMSSVSSEFRITRSDGEIRHIYSRGFHLKNEDGKAADILGFSNDITEHNEAKEWAKTQSDIINILKNSRNIKNASSEILKTLSNIFICDLIELWMINPEDNILRCIDVWQKENKEVDFFVTDSFKISFKKGVGLPGRVWKTKKSAWVSNIKLDTNFPRADLAKAAGLRSAFAMPISYGNTTYGVVEFFSSHTIKENPKLIKLMEILGVLIGEFIHQKHTEEQLNHISRHDILTGLMNRAVFEEEINRTLQSSPHLVALISLDLDRFKVICEEMGHEAGDLLLQAVVNKLTKVFPNEEVMMARLGADKFIIALLNLKSIEQIREHVQDIHNLFKEPFLIKGEDVFITTSMGVTVYPEDGEDIQVLLKKTEVTLSRVKEEGGNHFQFSSSNIESLNSDVIQLESSLRRALSENQFCLFYQPMVDLKTGRICGLEALIRWNHPEKGLLSPISFISVAEQSDIIVYIGEWVLHEVCRQITTKEIVATEEIPIAINLSVLQFNERHNLIGYIIKLIDDFGINPNVLELEVTEGILAKDMEESFRLLNTISKMDIRISLDDFGTGYSSLKYLQYFPVNKIKIDKSYIDGLPHNSKNIAIVRAIIALSHGLNKKVIAEGIETEEQLNFLIKENCDEIQGYYFSKPLPADQIKKMIEERKHLIISDNDRS